MSRFCSRCGKKFIDNDSFCSKCGRKRLTNHENKLFAAAHRSVIGVFILQTILFFIYPFIYFYKLSRSIQSENKLTTNNYHWWNMSVLVIFFGILVRYFVVLVYDFPSEDSGGLILSNFLIFIPILIWILWGGIFILIVTVHNIRLVNGVVPADSRVKLLPSLLLGPVYVQYKINHISNLGSKNTGKRMPVLRGYTLIVIIFISVSGILSATPPGRKLWAHTNANIGSYSTPLNEAGLDFKGKYYFLSSSPQLTSMDNVAKICENQADTTLSLGCNVHTDKKFTIYISQVNEPTLKGIEKYSMVHEMLHTAYAKLEPADKAKIDAALLNLYPKIMASGDTMTIKAIKPYQGEETKAIVNELHSIAPLYSANLGEPLETYYKQYFKDRSKIGIEFKKSEQIMQDAENNVSSWEKSINASESSMNEGLAIIERQSNTLNYYARTGNVYAYNSLVGIYNSNIDLYNTKYEAYLQQFKSYEQAYDRYSNLCNSLRRNITYKEASLAANKQLDKAK